MPEGDTIYRAAESLRSVMAGGIVVEANSPEPTIDAEELVGRTCDSVEPRGKHLLMHFDDGGAIHSHMGMTGSWHIYQVDERWQKPSRQAALVMTIKSNVRRVCVCFSPKTLEVLTSGGLRRHEWLSKLGPDILATDFDVDVIVRRLCENGHVPVGEAIMQQAIVCGVGNVYKSELLFMEQVHPQTPIDSIDDDTLKRLLQRTRKFMLRNLNGHRRQTRFAAGGPPLWVYQRSGERCLKCGEKIAMLRQGELQRSTYWCGGCQRLANVANFSTP